DAGLLAAALDDVLHVPHRRALVPGYDAVTAAARATGAFGATLSGSGSSILAVTPASAAPGVADAMAHAWRALGVTVETFVLSRPAGRYQVTGLTQETVPCPSRRTFPQYSRLTLAACVRCARAAARSVKPLPTWRHSTPPLDRACATRTATRIRSSCSI